MDRSGTAPGSATPALVSVVCPFYNEQATIDAFFEQVLAVIAPLPERFEIVCVNDGSRDATLERLVAWQQRGADRGATVRVVDLARNFGKEAALTAGIDHAQGDALVLIDADLQDPPALIAQLVSVWRTEAVDNVLARRCDRSSDTALKRLTAAWFYRLHNRVAEHPIPENVGDCRLISRAVVERLDRLPERRRFMKGILAWVGGSCRVVDYRRAARSKGDSRFSLWRLWNLALEGIASSSTVPLRIWSYVGAGVALAAFGYAAVIAVQTLTTGRAVPGYASLICAVLFLGGVQLIGLGVIGEYLGRVHTEVRQRPLYLVREVR